MCQDLKNQTESDPNFLSKVIMGDESRCYGYDPETKQASSQWKMPTSLRQKKARQVRSNVKKMLIVFINVQGIMHWEFVPPGQTVNQELYLEVLKRLGENVRKRPELWRSGDWFLHHDNAPAHTALSVTRYMASPGWTIVPHPPYSPDLAPWFLFIPDNEKNTERKEICHHGGGENSFAGGTEQHQASAVPEMLHTAGKKIGQAYCLQWRVFWRGLSVLCMKCK